MYGVQGRTWVALGDPVGPPETMSDLIRLFLERCDDFDGMPVFYEVGKAHLHRYADFGLTFVKLGEEARVDLHAFSLDGPSGARYRQVDPAAREGRRPVRDRAVVGGPGHPDQLRAVSDDWLADTRRRREGLLARLLRRRLCRRGSRSRWCDVDGQIVAFANIWRGADGQEVSVDLMRFSRDAPKGVMEALFANS